MKERQLLTCRVLAAILWRWRSTGPEVLLKVTRRIGPSGLDIGWRFIRSSAMEAIKAASSVCGMPAATLEFNGALSDCNAAHSVVVAR